MKNPLLGQGERDLLNVSEHDLGGHMFDQNDILTIDFPQLEILTISSINIQNLVNK